MDDRRHCCDRCLLKGVPAAVWQQPSASFRPEQQHSLLSTTQHSRHPLMMDQRQTHTVFSELKPQQLTALQPNTVSCSPCQHRASCLQKPTGAKRTGPARRLQTHKPTTAPSVTPTSHTLCEPPAVPEPQNSPLQQSCTTGSAQQSQKPRNFDGTPAGDLALNLRGCGTQSGAAPQVTARCGTQPVHHLLYR